MRQTYLLLSLLLVFQMTFAQTNSRKQNSLNKENKTVQMTGGFEDGVMTDEQI